MKSMASISRGWTEDKLRVALGISAIATTALAIAIICAERFHTSSIESLSIAAASIHASWMHIYAPAMPCPAGRISAYSIRFWMRHITDCYFPGMRQWSVGIRLAKGCRLGARITPA
jgi:hypothetical protein